MRGAPVSGSRRFTVAGCCCRSRCKLAKLARQIREGLVAGGILVAAGEDEAQGPLRVQGDAGSQRQVRRYHPVQHHAAPSLSG